jgi:hypothetical protein
MMANVLLLLVVLAALGKLLHGAVRKFLTTAGSAGLTARQNRVTDRVMRHSANVKSMIEENDVPAVWRGQNVLF